MGAACSCSKGSVSVAPEEAVAEPAAAAAPAPRADGQKRLHKANRRGSVSAEASALSAVKFQKKSLTPKSEETRERLRLLIKSTLLFHDLEEEQEQGVIDALFERKVEAGEVVIREGEVGDNFYVIEAGTFRATKGGELKFTYEGKGSFGELALMYNCPRAATVTAEGPGTLWVCDRTTFRAVIVSSMAERRERYEATLRGMPLLKHLSQEQLAAIADCVTVEAFEPGQLILREGEELATNAKFYLIESGTVECKRTVEGEKRLTKTLGPGDVFGEVALVTKAPRQADCVAADNVKCLAMSRDAFERLMGPVEESLAQHIAAYGQLNSGEAAAAAGNNSGSRASTPGSHHTTAGTTSIASVGVRTTAASQPASAATSRAPSHGLEAPPAGGAGAGAGAAALVPPGSVGKSPLKLGRTSSGDTGSPSKLREQIQEWERRMSGTGEATTPSPTKRKSRGSSGSREAESGPDGAAAALLIHADEAKRMADLSLQPAGGEGAEEAPACSLEPIVEEQAEAGSRRGTAHHR